MRGGIWKGTLSFGLINIPITVQSAEMDHDLHFNMLDGRNLAPIQYKRINSKTGKEVPYDQIVKGYKYQSGHYVIMDKEDFKKANPKATQSIDIEDFVKLDEIDLMMFERPYYLVPQKGGEKGYFLLQEALRSAKKAAIAKVVMHTKEHLVCIFPRGQYLILEILRFAHSLKSLKEADYLHTKASDMKVKPQEVKMATRLIDDMTAKWRPDQYKDTYYNDLMGRIEAKIKAGKGKIIEKEKVSTAEFKPTKSKDLMALLKASLEKKPINKKAPLKQVAKKSSQRSSGRSHLH